jgi:hypothetical protein
MKKCTYCGKEYSDDATACIDGQLLTQVTEPTKPSSSRTDSDAAFVQMCLWAGVFLSLLAFAIMYATEGEPGRSVLQSMHTWVMHHLFNLRVSDPSNRAFGAGLYLAGWVLSACIGAVAGGFTGAALARRSPPTVVWLILGALIAIIAIGFLMFFVR